MTHLAAVATGEFQTPILCDAKDVELKVNDFCVFRTPQGNEATGYVKAFSVLRQKQVENRALGRVLRKAGSEDVRTWHFLKRREKEAVEKCKEYVLKHKLDMKISSVDFKDNEHKIVFNFTADDRVDFRELVKDLAAEFHSRIELWQIGVRDEAKEIGGLGCCGLTMCCATWMRKFIPVSIRYAKAQDIQFSPSKLSGACGRLRCCLAYEQKQYLDMGKNVPPIGSRVESQEFGIARVTERNLLSGSLTLATEDKHFTINIEEVECKRIRAPEDNAEKGWTKGQKIWLLEPNAKSDALDEVPEIKERKPERDGQRKPDRQERPESSDRKSPEPSESRDSKSDSDSKGDSSDSKSRDNRSRGRRRRSKPSRSDRGGKSGDNGQKSDGEQNKKRRPRRGGRRRKRNADRGGKDAPKK